MARKNKHNPDALTKAQLKFCEAFALDGNGAAAYGKAFPSSLKHTSQYRSEKACKLLVCTKISAKAQQLKDKVAQIANNKFEITAERVLRELALIAFQNSQDYFDWGAFDRPVRRKNKETGLHEVLLDEAGKPITEPVPYARLKPSAELDRDKMAAVVAVSETISRTGDRVIEAKMADKLGALKLIGQHLDMFKTAKPGDSKVNVAGKVVHEHVLPDMTGVSDPRDALRKFEAFRLGLTAAAGNA